MNARRTSAGVGPRMILAGAAVAALAAVGWWLLIRPDATDEVAFSPSAAYEVLRSTPVSAGVVPDGLRFSGIQGTLPPHEAQERGLWLVYADFERPRGTARLAFQIFGSASEADDFVETQFDGPCAQDEVAWECSGASGPVVIKARVECPASRCAGGRDEATGLLDAGRNHLRESYPGFRDD